MGAKPLESSTHSIMAGVCSSCPGSEDQDLDKISRYEAHLERRLYRALRELERFQAGRNGLISPAVAVDVNVTGRGSD